MNVVSWSPFREFEDIFNRYGLLNNSADEAGNRERPRAWRPAANISETEKAYLIRAELPEVDKKDVEVSVQDGVITIKGERRYEKSDDSEKLHRVESYYGSFSRSFSLPADADDSQISATSKDGVLTVEVPKSPVAKARSIEVKVR